MSYTSLYLQQVREVLFGLEDEVTHDEFQRRYGEITRYTKPLFYRKACWFTIMDVIKFVITMP